MHIHRVSVAIVKSNARHLCDVQAIPNINLKVELLGLVVWANNVMLLLRFYNFISDNLFLRMFYTFVSANLIFENWFEIFKLLFVIL